MPIHRVQLMLQLLQFFRLFLYKYYGVFYLFDGEGFVVFFLVDVVGDDGHDGGEDDPILRSPLDHMHQIQLTLLLLRYPQRLKHHPQSTIKISRLLLPLLLHIIRIHLQLAKFKFFHPIVPRNVLEDALAADVVDNLYLVYSEEGKLASQLRNKTVIFKRVGNSLRIRNSPLQPPLQYQRLQLILQLYLKSLSQPMLLLIIHLLEVLVKGADTAVFFQVEPLVCLEDLFKFVAGFAA